MVLTRNQQSQRTANVRPKSKSDENSGDSGRDECRVKSKPAPLLLSSNENPPLPDSTTPPAVRDKDAVVTTTSDENAATEPAKGKRRKRKNRKRKLTAEIQSQTVQTTDSSISSSSPKHQKTTTEAEQRSPVSDEPQKENVKTTPLVEVELEANDNLEDTKVETKILAVNVREVIQLYKKESYADGQAVKPKGKPKSGRHWKTEQTQRFSGMKQDRPLKTSWQKKMKQKADLKNMKSFEAELKEARDSELERKKKFRAKKIKRKLENQRKSEVVQVISNPAKIKRMKKKQLRNIEKRSMPDSSKKQVFKS